MIGTPSGGPLSASSAAGIAAPPVSGTGVELRGRVNYCLMSAVCNLEML